MRAALTAPIVIGKITTGIVVLGSMLLLIFSLQLALWAAEREPPFEMLNYAVTPARAGETTIARANVRRDLERRCSVVFSRMFFDSAGTRWELTEGAQMMNARALENYNNFSPNVLSFSVNIPATAQPGPAKVVTVLDYQCNPIHQGYPIPVVLDMKFEVIP